MSLTVTLAVVFGLGWRLIFNVIEYHVLESANNAFKFWGYFHNGKSTAMQLLVWSAAYWVLHYYKQFLQQQNRARRAELESKAATLKLLQYQINPHFLFNVLGSLDTLLLKNSSAEARIMLGKLTRYLRTSLESEPSVSIALPHEIERVRTYLDIEQIRFGNRIQVDWSIPEQVPEIQIPNGILLPIVENALKHGKVASSVGGRLSISITAQPQSSAICISNHRQDRKTEKGFGLGLTNTRQRLLSFYQGDAALDIDKTDKAYIVTVKIPNSHEL